MAWTTLELLIALASGLRATTYGHGELSCGAYPPRPCVAGEVTASGEVFVPDIPSAAVASPRGMRMRAKWIWIRIASGPTPCVKVRLNDKSHQRWLGNRGFDLSPGAVRLLTKRPPRADWSATVEVCAAA